MSEASLRAALAPADTPYFYYVVGDDRGPAQVRRHRAKSTSANIEARARPACCDRGATRLAGIIGDPVRHSLSPILHNAAYRELGLDWVYVAFEVPDGEHRRRARRRMRDARPRSACRSRCRTRPRRRACATSVSASRPRLRSVNTVTLQADGSLAGDSTDGEGFVRSLREAEP